MKFREYKAKVQKFPFFSSNQLAGIVGDRQLLRNQLFRWQKKGLVIKLRRGLYGLAKSERRVECSETALAAQLVSPSYLSMEYALSRYELIPEGVFTYTSVTTKKTQTIDNPLGRFSYQHIKEECLAGFRAEKDNNGFTYYQAEPEKAVVDFLYLKLQNFQRDDLDIFEDSYRFQNTEDLKFNKLVAYGKLFSSNKLDKIIDNFCRFARKQRASFKDL